ncbi:glycoside hydrolase domain-containing protein [Streptomyces xylophagus]|uniref:glycoside hydrolase domain-containing protein n=1 Tax=Streptomyces xylophagus TaxID=285514 RepID=UPI0005B8E776|nr:glycoside hydrolase domain-containing protein [Streptomyces xylophagus]
MADAKVLEAQQWVNGTYGSVPGYQRCPETGTIGWSTMYSLIMGLQKELGISPVVANFGDGTVTKLAALGELGSGWAQNNNIIKIIRYGLFCKGYTGGYSDTGYYDPDITLAVKHMQGDMGLSQSGSLQAKVFKALLNMDAYVVTAGGSDKVRSIQQWLNGRYWTKKTVDIGPADGHYSRNVQQNLMKALQLEIGIAEADATGNFGSGTQAGIKSKALVSEGSSGIFVQLFSAACVFNQPIVTISASGDTIETNTVFKTTFDSNLTSFVTTFQHFSALSGTGRGDYATWAQLLVSMGDPDRPVIASDTAYTITPSRAARMYSDGYRYVGRYLNEASAGGGSKMLEEGELANIFAGGLRVFPIFQDNGRTLAEYYWGNGFAHAQKAHDQAVHFGLNRGTIIYFAVDYDATDADMPQILEYFRGVASGLGSKGKRYVHGVYGSRNVCAQVTKETYARYSFVSGMSWGFSGNLGYPLPSNWSFNQIKEYQVTNGTDTFALDRDAYRIGSDPGENSINRPSSRADEFVTYIQSLYDLAKDYGKVDPNQLVMEYLRSARYDDAPWRSLIGPSNPGFIAYANDHNMGIWTEFKDPFTGQDLGPEHMMATANGQYLRPNPRGDISLGDVAGWGGDLMTLYGEWRRDHDSYASGVTYIGDKMGKIGVYSTFGFTDLVEDADGYLIAQAMRGGKTIVEAVHDHYVGSGGLTRFRDYVSQRFGGTISEAAAQAKKIPTDAAPTTDGAILVAGRTILITKFGGALTLMPVALPSGQLDDWCNAFGDNLVQHASTETLRRAEYRANQQRLLSPH